LTVSLLPLTPAHCLPALPPASPPSVPRNETTSTAYDDSPQIPRSDSSDSLSFVSYTTAPAIPPVRDSCQVSITRILPVRSESVRCTYRVMVTQQYDDSQSPFADSRYWLEVYRDSCRRLWQTPPHPDALNKVLGVTISTLAGFKTISLFLAEYRGSFTPPKRIISRQNAVPFPR
jgi:hypothetical protein